MSRTRLVAALLVLPIVSGFGIAIAQNAGAQNANDDAAKAALTAGFSKLKQTAPDTAAQNPVGVTAGFEAVTREREFQAQLSAEQARYQAASPGLCQARMRTIQQCVADRAPTCEVPAGLEGFSVGFCRSLPLRPADPIVLTATKPLDCDDGQCQDTGDFWRDLRRAQAEWDARYRDAYRTCQDNRQVLEAAEACLAPARAACNPEGLTEAVCLSGREAARPTRESFKARLEQVSTGGAKSLDPKAPAPRKEDYPGQDAALASYAQALKAAGIDPAKPPAKLYAYELEKTFGNIQVVDSQETARASPAVMRKSWEDAAVTLYGTPVTVLSVGQVSCDTAYASVDPQRPHRCRQTVRYRITSKSPPADGAEGKTVSR